MNTHYQVITADRIAAVIERITGRVHADADTCYRETDKAAWQRVRELLESGVADADISREDVR